MEYSTDDSLTLFDDSKDLWDVTVLPAELRSDDTDQDADDFLNSDIEDSTEKESSDSNSLTLITNTTKYFSHRYKEPYYKNVGNFDDKPSAEKAIRKLEGEWRRSQKFYLPTGLMTFYKCGSCKKCPVKIYLLEHCGLKSTSLFKSTKRHVRLRNISKAVGVKVSRSLVSSVNPRFRQTKDQLIRHEN